MGRIQFTHTYDDIISFKNILSAWREFVRGKKNKKDVQEFAFNLPDNLISIQQELEKKSYKHGTYEYFKVMDPKLRDIHKATVRDRLLHHAVYRTLYPFFEKTFIADSYSCRVGKGTHRAMKQFVRFGNKVSMNNMKTCWVLKCDIRKFFASIDQEILLKILGEYIPDQDIMWLIEEIMRSFSSTIPGKGLPLGNLTSQLLVNVYMNKFDQFMKHKIKAKYYIRYADDFVIMSRDREWLESIIPRISTFLLDGLKLNLHPDKVFLKTLASGVDFLGWVHFFDYRVLRTSTKRRMFKALKKDAREEVRASYLGMIIHGNSQKLRMKIKNTASSH